MILKWISGITPSKVWAALVAVLGMLVLFLRGSLWKSKAKEYEGEAAREKGVREASDEATEALLKGLNDEAKKESNPRDYKFDE